MCPRLRVPWRYGPRRKWRVHPDFCLYNDNDECNEEGTVGKMTILNGHFMRSFSSPNYSFSMTASITSGSGTECIDGADEYNDHKDKLQPCSWLGGNGHVDGNIAWHRQEKNCGSSTHGITELGQQCPWSCRAYNDCGS